MTLDKEKDKPFAANRLRNLVIAFANFCFVTWLFGLFYGWTRDLGFEETIVTVWGAIYFSFVTGSTLGYGDIYPDSTTLLAIWK